MSDAPSQQPIARRIRWWPVPIILLIGIGAAIWVRFNYGAQRQDQNILIAIVGIVTFGLLLLWCLLLSRMRWKVRLTALALVILLIAATPLLFRMHGVTGDLVPIPEWRWKRQPQVSSAPGTVPVPTTQAQSTAATVVATNDYPQFLGPHRDATVDTPRLARDWKTQPPVVLWRRPIGTAWSGFAVVGTRAVTQEQQGEEEVVSCYDLFSGAPVWSRAYPAHFQSSLAGEGPRATPTIVSNRVFALGSTGILNCLDLATGKVLWSKDIVRDNQSKINEWGISCSPLVMGSWVVTSAGGHNERSLVAYDVDTGAFAWGAGEGGAGYSSPLIVTLAGVPQILIFNSSGILGHAAADGRILWHYPWPGGHPHVAMPVILPGDRVLASSGYGVGSEVFEIKKNAEGKLTSTRVWKSNRLKAKFTNVIHLNGFIYGLDDGIMACVDASDGSLKWKSGRYGHGQEILAAGLLLVMAESGEIILVEPNPKELSELARYAVFKDKTWNPPALAGEILVVRNDKEAACLRLPLAK